MITGLDPFPPDEPVTEFHRDGKLIDLYNAGNLRSIELVWPERLDVTFEILLEHVFPEFGLVADALVFSFRRLSRVEITDRPPGVESDRGTLLNFGYVPEGETATLFDIEIEGVELVVVAEDLNVDVVTGEA